MNDLRYHPAIRQTEATGYAGTVTAAIRCPACGEELTLDDDIYTGFNGDVIGCGHCVKRHDITEVFEDE